ncbi:DinB family protein, partial [Rubripirellula sp.]|nr:DinB family protein [Rubripirellula sp.]
MTQTPHVHSLPKLDQVPVILEAAIEQINFARNYTLELLAATPEKDWFFIPSGLTTHLAWQVGHLAVSQYGLLMFRIRGRHPDDLDLIPGRFRKAYSRQSTPSSDTEKQPTA